MSKDDLVRFEGRVSTAAGGGTYKIVLEGNGVVVNARLSGKMRRFKIRILAGDRVTVAMSPTDLTHGLIVHRHKAGDMIPQNPSGGA